MTWEDIKQVIRSSASIGANYIEANENLGRADKIMRLKISRKEAKETIFFLRLFPTQPSIEDENELEWLINESTQLKNIFSVIILKCE